MFIIFWLTEMPPVAAGNDPLNLSRVDALLVQRPLTHDV